MEPAWLRSGSGDTNLRYSEETEKGSARIGRRPWFGFKERGGP